ncbi:hypothetical protein [Pseudoalteromonas sp.]|uniref:hypothetical protein n=1 Tax=Pseudoalteromonas sp. TaxID=53249 RepID=UPI003F98428B
MKFYIIKKASRIAAIPAEEELLEDYKSKGFKFVEVIAASDKDDALARSPTRLKKHKKWLVLCSTFALLAIIITFLSLN